MTTKEFIEKKLIPELEDIVCRHKYFSFALIAAGIEFLGKCLDNVNDWNEKGLSETHFNYAIDILFNKNFKKANKKYNFYKELRCGFAHSFRPMELILLTNKKEAKEHKNYHLKEENGRVYIVIEDFYEDFKKACEKIISKDNINKMDEFFLNTPEDDYDNKNIELMNNFSETLGASSMPKINK
ncbi:hypothetical protein K9M42_03265 [Patescibacteria group bacterium]|nr:hypothetical protein [Patescibacteria group bacterium]